MTSLHQQVSFLKQDEVPQTPADQSDQDKCVMQMLKDCQRKDAEEVSTGLRSPQSLFLFQKCDVDKFRVTENPNSEFNCIGDEW